MIQNRSKSTGLILGISGGLLFFYQNCGQGFRATNPYTGQSSEIFSGPRPIPNTPSESGSAANTVPREANPALSSGSSPAPKELKGRAALKGMDLFTSLPFQLGLTHWGSNYRFTNENFFSEGYKLAVELGAPALFLTLDNKYIYNYGKEGWGSTPKNLVELAKTPPIKAALGDPKLNTLVINAFSFSVGAEVWTFPDENSSVWEEKEYREIYDLTKHLMTTYAASGKVFILKNWETDWAAQAGYNLNYNLTDPKRISVLKKWFKIRQKAVEDARKDFLTQGVFVLFAAEVNLVLDAYKKAPNQDKKVINTVLVDVSPDLIAYSAYEATNELSEADIKSVLEYIHQTVPDRLGLGRKRVFISEFGLAEENRRNDGTVILERFKVPVEAAKKFGASYAFLWQLFDNSCKDPVGVKITEYDEESPFAIGHPRRPANKDCSGFWVKKPDGKFSILLPELKKIWQSTPVEMP